MHAMPSALSLSFIALVAIIYSAVILGITYAIGKGSDERRLPVFGLRLLMGGWILVTGLLAVQGFFLDFSATPPHIVVAAMIAMLAFVVFAFSRALGRWIKEIRQPWLIGAQAFRIVVEIQLYFLAMTEYLPRLMTFEGRNFDIIVGVTAPLVAAVVYKAGERKTRRLILGWNVASMLILANTVVTGVLSAPTPFRKFMEEPANTAMGYFPFAWLPAFVVPFAFFLHLVSIRRALAISR